MDEHVVMWYIYIWGGMDIGMGINKSVCINVKISLEIKDLENEKKLEC